MANGKTRQKKEPILIRSFSLTPALDKTLQRLSQEGSDFTGWSISSSAVVRALLRYVEQQPASWASSVLFPLIGREIARGTVWGSKKK